MHNYRIGITGYNGFIGSKLSEVFAKLGANVIKIPRNDFSHLEGLDIIINLSGENISGHYWTNSFKQKLYDSRIQTLKNFKKTIDTLNSPPKLFLSASAIGFYGDQGSKLLDENSAKGKGFLSDLVQDWEKEAMKIDSLRTQVLCLRFGMVLGQNGGALKKLTSLFKIVGAVMLGKKDQYISWIHIDDLVKAVLFLINTPPIQTPINVVAPYPVTNHTFTTLLAKKLHRAFLFKIPVFLVKFLMGQMGKELFLHSVRVVPKRLQEHHFIFDYPHLSQAFDQIIDNS